MGRIIRMTTVAAGLRELSFFEVEPGFQATDDYADLLGRVRAGGNAGQADNMIKVHSNL
jgi:hypothetical protein